MNMQALMQQAQRMQKDLMKKKDELVEVVFNGNKELISINIKKDHSLEVEDIEILEDMIKIAVKDALNKVDKEINEKMGAAAGPLSGLI